MIFFIAFFRLLYILFLLPIHFFIKIFSPILPKRFVSYWNKEMKKEAEDLRVLSQKIKNY